MAADSPDRDGDAAGDTAALAARVRERLDRVTDPELDTSIVELDYIDEIRIDDADADGQSPSERGASAVHVAFTLPTAWCSPAFAWMMATDARDEVEGLPGVDRATVELREHMHDGEINRSVNEGLSFEAAFPDADGGVEAVRADLDAKARLARQHEATGALLDAGLSDEQVVTLTRDDLAFDAAAEGRVHVWVRTDALAVTVDAAPLSRYLDKAETTGVLADDRPELFRTPDGDPIDPARFETVRHRTRLAGVNMSGQGSVCDALNEARQAEDRPPLSSWAE